MKIFNKFRIAILIYGYCFLGFIICLIGFYPGWMTPDSLTQYTDAKNLIYHDWHPVMMSFYWSKLLMLVDGPALLLVQNLALYWLGVGFLASAMKHKFSHSTAFLTLIVFSIPSVLVLVGVIWKDVVFAIHIFFLWSFLINRSFLQKPLTNWQRGIIILISIFAVGTKPNGVLSVLCLFTYWIIQEKKNWKIRSSIFGAFILAGVVSLLCVLIIPRKHVILTYPVQYTLVYDILAVSVKSGVNFLPPYLTDKFGSDVKNLIPYYSAGGNNHFFYNSFGNIAIEDKASYDDLRTHWLMAVKNDPFSYLLHRWENFLSLLRIGYNSKAYVTNVGVLDNSYGITFQHNKISSIFEGLIYNYEIFYFPWIFILLSCIFGTYLWKNMPKERILIGSVFASIALFVLPHFFIVPASDYRYLFYSNLTTLILAPLSFGVARRKSKRYLMKLENET